MKSGFLSKHFIARILFSIHICLIAVFITVGCGPTSDGTTASDFATYLATGIPRSLSTDDFGKLSTPCESTTQLSARYSGHKCVYMYADSFYQSDVGTGLAQNYPTASLESAISNAKTYFTSVSATFPVHIIVITRGTFSNSTTSNLGSLNGTMHFYSGTSTIPSLEL